MQPQKNMNSRIMNDFKRIQKDPPEGCCVSPLEDDLTRWSGYLFGPEDTEWEGGIFYIEIIYPEDYPAKAPKIYFKPPILHPNVHIDEKNSGLVSMDIVKTNWSSIIDTWTLLISLRSLLTDPNPTTYANQYAHQLYFQNRNIFKQQVQKYIANYIPADPNDETKNLEDQSVITEKLTVINKIVSELV